MSILQSVDPELRALLVEDEEIIPITRHTLPSIRARSAERYQLRPVYGSTIPTKQTITSDGVDLDLFLFAPPQTTPAPRPCLIWLHGGGYIMGRADDMWNGPLFAEQANCLVISVDYRLAPEHPYPAGLHDAVAALDWAHTNAKDLNIDPNRIAVGGASAGAGLAAGLALYNRDLGNLPIAFQLLLYPMLDNLHDTASGQRPDHPIWNRADSLSAWEMYLNGTPRSGAPCYAAPSRVTDLSDLPTAMISVGDVDLFLDENIQYAQALRSHGVTCELRQYPGMIHAGEVAGHATKVGTAMIHDYVSALKQSFSQG